MYHDKKIKRATHFELKIEDLHWVLKQFNKIREYAWEGKLHPFAISITQLQEVITEIHTKMEEYDFPIPTIHIRAELLSQTGKTDKIVWCTIDSKWCSF